MSFSFSEYACVVSGGSATDVITSFGRIRGREVGITITAVALSNRRYITPGDQHIHAPRGMR